MILIDVLVRWIERLAERAVRYRLKTIFRASKRTVGTKIRDDLLQLRRFGHNPRPRPAPVEKEVDFWRSADHRLGGIAPTIYSTNISNRNIFAACFLGPALPGPRAERSLPLHLIHHRGTASTVAPKHRGSGELSRHRAIGIALIGMQARTSMPKLVVDSDGTDLNARPTRTTPPRRSFGTTDSMKLFALCGGSRSCATCHVPR